MLGEITVERDVLHHIERLLQNDSFPFSECRHAAAGGAACDQLYVGNEPTHQLGGFTGNRAVFAGGLGTDLPRSVHFIAQAPKPDVMGSRMPVLMPQVAERGPTFDVAIFEQRPRLVRASCAEVYGHHWLQT